MKTTLALCFVVALHFAIFDSGSSNLGLVISFGV